MGYVAEVLLAAGVGLVLTIVAVVALTRSRWRATRIAWSLAVMLLAVATLTSPFAISAAQSAIFRATLPHHPAPVAASLNLFVNRPTPQLRQTLLALQARDGSERWQRQATNPAQVGFTIADGVVYIAEGGAGTPQNASAGGTVTALRASDGAVLWTTRITGTVQVGAQPGVSTIPLGPITAAPVVADGNVYVGATFQASALNAGLIVALRSSDGHVLWQQQVDAGVSQQPVAAGSGLVYVAGTSGLRALRASDGSVAWTGLSQGQPVYHASVLYEIPAVGSDMRIIALRAADGRLLWTSDDLRGPATAPRVVATADPGDGVVAVGLVTAENGTQAYLAALDAASGKQRWLATLPGWPQGTTIASGVMYVGTTGGLVALDAASGKVLWQRSTGRYITYHHPQVMGDVIFVTSTNDEPHYTPCLGDCGEPDLLNALSARDGSFYWRQPLDWAGAPLAVA